MGNAHASRASASGYDPLVDGEAGTIDPETGPNTAFDEEAIVVRAAVIAAGCVKLDCAVAWCPRMCRRALVCRMGAASWASSLQTGAQTEKFWCRRVCLSTPESAIVCSPVCSDDAQKVAPSALLYFN